MKKHSLTIALAIVSIGFCLVSCSKKEDETSTPAPLTPQAAKEELDKSNAEIATTQVALSAATISTTSAINSLSSLRNSSESGLSNLSSDLFPQIGGFSGGRLESSPEQLLANALGSFAKASAFGFASARAEDKLEFGTYELVLDNTSGGFSGSYCSDSKKYYKRKFKFTAGGDKIVFKYPTKSLNSCDSIWQNNAIYTITKADTKEVKFTRCGVERTEELFTKITATLEINGTAVMSYEYSIDSDFTTFYKSNGKLVVGDYTYNFNSENSQTSYSFSTEWSGKGGKVYSYSGKTEYVSANIECDDNDNENKDRLSWQENTKSTSNSYSYGKITVKSSTQPNAYISEVKTKYSVSKGSDITKEKLEAIESDSVLYDKYHTVELLAENGAKIGDIVFSSETQGSGNFTYKNWVSYLKYSDGSREKLLSKFPYGAVAAYRNSYFYVSFSSNNGQDK